MLDNSITETDIPRPRKFDRKSRLISKYKRRVFKHVWVVRVLIIALVVVGLYFVTTFIKDSLKDTKVSNYYNLASDFIFTPDGKLDSFEGRTNVVILGKSGEGHDSPDLTDTIIFASFSNEVPSVTMISLPRDIWIDELRAKLNSVYYWGNQKQEGGGLILVKSVIEEIVGQPVHYGVIIDFDGFVDVIDELGGVEVDVQNSFVDERYPIAGKEDDECDGDEEFLCRYETIEFKKGTVMMDGATALKFTRSRNADSDEGTDLAREARQQLVIEAVKTKMLSREFALSPKKMIKIMGVFDQSIETDLDSSGKSLLARRLLDARDGLRSEVLPEVFLVNPPISYIYDNLYVFIPAGEGWQEVNGWVKSALSN